MFKSTFIFVCLWAELLIQLFPFSVVWSSILIVKYIYILALYLCYIANTSPQFYFACNVLFQANLLIFFISLNFKSLLENLSLHQSKKISFSFSSSVCIVYSLPLDHWSHWSLYIYMMRDMDLNLSFFQMATQLSQCHLLRSPSLASYLRCHLKFIMPSVFLCSWFDFAGCILSSSFIHVPVPHFDYSDFIVCLCLCVWYH